MDKEDSTTVIKMLNDLKSNTEGCLRNIGSFLQFPDIGVTTSTSFRLAVDEDEKTTPKRRKISDVCEKYCTETDIVPGSPWEWRRLKGEIVSLRTRLLHQEGTVYQLHQIRRQMEEVFQKEKNVLEMQTEADKQLIKQLELRVESMRKFIHEGREAQALTENKYYQMKAKLEKEISVLIEENAKLLEDMKSIREEKSQVSSPISQEQIPIYQIQLELAEKRITELEQKSKDTQKLEQELELKTIDNLNFKLKIEKLESECALWQKKKLLCVGSAHTQDLEKELDIAKETIAKMRESIKGKLLLEEQMSNIMQRLKHTELVEQHLASLRVEHDQLLKKLNEYESINIGDGPLTLKKEVHRLQKAEAILTADEGQLRSQIDSARHEYQLLYQKYKYNEKTANELSTSNERLNSLIGRLQKKILLITGERDNYRQQLGLYEKEVSDQNIAQGRVPTLERALEGYRDLVSKLEADLDISGTAASREECQKLKEDVEKLKRELEHRALKGDFNCNNKILHLKLNPATIASQQAQEKMQILKLEVEKLRQHTQLDISGIVNTSATQIQEITELKKNYDIKIARLKNAFKISSQEYRQACYQLFGWRVDRTKEGRYKLSSQYAESPDDFLFFQVGRGVDLLETDFSATLGSLIEHHLKTQHSVPMFLCAVQSELFSQQTATNVVI